MLRQPGGFHLGRRLGKGGLAPGHKGIHEYQVPTETGFDRPLPAASYGAKYRLREDGTKLLGYLLWRAVGVIVLQHEGITEARGQFRVHRLIGEGR